MKTFVTGEGGQCLFLNYYWYYFTTEESTENVIQDSIVVGENWLRELASIFCHSSSSPADHQFTSVTWGLQPALGHHKCLTRGSLHQLTLSRNSICTPMSLARNGISKSL
jgi:hypothetical protein